MRHPDRDTAGMDTAVSSPPGPRARLALAANAGLAWVGIVLTVVVSALGGYRDAPVEPGLYGGRPEGLAGAPGRVLDTLSYFTLWSNIVVAVSLTLLLRRPLRALVGVRLLRLAGLLMITVTAVVYQVLLAPTADVVGWSRLTDPILHVLTPAVTVLVWLAVGPRGWVTGRLVPAALVVPLAWIAWMLARGAVSGTYPYGFVDVGSRGAAAVAGTLGAILVFGVVVAALFWAVDVGVARLSTRSRR